MAVSIINKVVKHNNMLWHTINLRHFQVMTNY